MVSETTNVINGTDNVDEDEENMLHLLRNYNHFMNEGETNDEDTKPLIINKFEASNEKQVDIKDDMQKETGDKVNEDHEKCEIDTLEDGAINNHSTEEDEDEDLDEAELQWLCQADPGTLDMSKLSEEEISRKRKAYNILKRKANKLKLEIDPDLDETNKIGDNHSIIPFSKRRPQINYREGDIKPFR